jgi:hypothetical protein
VAPHCALRTQPTEPLLALPARLAPPPAACAEEGLDALLDLLTTLWMEEAVARGTESALTPLTPPISGRKDAA